MELEFTALYVPGEIQTGEHIETLMRCRGERKEKTTLRVDNYIIAGEGEGNVKSNERTLLTLIILCGCCGCLL